MILNRVTTQKIIFVALAFSCLAPFVSSSAALFLGVIFAVALGNPWQQQLRRITSRLLAVSVMGLGAGMNLKVIADVGMKGFGYTLLSISFTLILGFLLGKILRVEKNISILTSIGTAICGGSAIAAASPVLGARPHEVSVSLGTVFILNAVALILFPWLGHRLHMDEAHFGLWSALAIHDTSSVVGATLQFGPQALVVGTTVKLARALWIVPVTLILGWLTHSEGKGKAKRPWFILGFLAIAAVVTWVPSLQPAGHWIEAISKRSLVVTLFLIGSGLTLSVLKNVGIKPFLQGFLLWVMIATLTLLAVTSNLLQG